MAFMSDVRYYYLRRKSGHEPFGCVAFRFNDDGTVNRGISLCSVEDRFDRRKARGIALKRLNDVAHGHEDVYFRMPCGWRHTNPVLFHEVYSACDENDPDYGVLFDDNQGEARHFRRGDPSYPWMKNDDGEFFFDKGIVSARYHSEPTDFELKIFGIGKEE